MPLIWPGRRFVSRGNPQGVIAAPAGAYCVDEVNGRIYLKKGQHNQWGWYPYVTPNEGNWYAWRPIGGGTGAPLLGGIGCDTGQLNLIGAGNWQAMGINTNPLTQNVPTFMRGFTGAAATNYNYWAPGALAGLQAYGDNNTPAGGFVNTPMDWDISQQIITTVPVNSTVAQPDTTLALCRHWGLVVRGSAAFRAGGLVDSDNITTAYAAGAGRRFAIRFSTAAADPGWVGVSCTNAGVQVVTPTALNSTPLVATSGGQLWTLRIRRVNATGLAYFSVNDGPEQTLIGSIVAAQIEGAVLMVECAVQTLEAARKTVGLVGGLCVFGVL